MSGKLLRGIASVLISIFVLGGCALFGPDIPPGQEQNYALIESRISEHGLNVDTMSSSQGMYDSTASIGWINGKARFPARSSINVLPGEYEFSVGLGCSNSATCRPSPAVALDVKAGFRYVLTPNGVYVSDRSKPRNKATETLYHPEK